MRVHLSEQLFESADALGVTALIELARDGRHQLLLRPSFRDRDERELPRNRWLHGHHPDMRDQLCGLLSVCARDASSSGPNTMSITVVATEHSRWASLELTPVDALRLLRTPLKLLIENRRNDWLFLRALFPPQLRADLDRAEQNGWIDVAGVPLSEMKPRLMSWTQERSSATLSLQLTMRRTWLMFDRDAATNDPLQPSKDSEEVRELCEDLELPHHQLARRTIESYLPSEILGRLHSSSTNSRQARLVALRQLREQYPECAFALSMKEGLMKDTALDKRDRDPCKQRWDQARDPEMRRTLCEGIVELMPLAWQELPEQLRADLLIGFGGKCATLFEQCESATDWDRWFQSEYDRGPSQQPDRAEFASTLLGLI